MEFKLLAVGDVVGDPGVERICRSLRYLKRKTLADFVVVNGENASMVGITPQQCEDILDAGADVITLGNHTFGRREIIDYLESSSRVLRPFNYAPQTPGRGFGLFDTRCGPVAIFNLVGRCNMDFAPDNPFLLMEKTLKKLSAKFIFVDMHAEATSEKLAMAHMLDGRITGLWGTHTHVPTSDTQVLPHGTGYVTDLGMTGPKNGILGVQVKQSVAKFRGDLTGRYQWENGPTKLEAVLFTADPETGLCTNVERVDLYD